MNERIASEMFTLDGFCPICRSNVQFKAERAWYRDFLTCPSCPGGFSVPRDRALALVLSELAPDWRNRAIHESSPGSHGISALMARDCLFYVASQFFPGHNKGDVVNGVRHENLEDLSFGDRRFDITVTLDVMEHVYQPDRVFKEVHRTLRPGGYYLCTFPVRKWQVNAWERRFETRPDGSRVDFKPPEIHGNPVSPDGSIVTVDWGYDLHQQIAEWAPFDVRVYRFSDRLHGILGEYTEVIACRAR
jgi:SAM-dependent methyltransferase